MQTGRGLEPRSEEQKKNRGEKGSAPRGRQSLRCGLVPDRISQLGGQDPEDLVQEVYCRALSSGVLERFEDVRRGRLGALLASILHNTIVDTVRRARCSRHDWIGQ